MAIKVEVSWGLKRELHFVDAPVMFQVVVFQTTKEHSMRTIRKFFKTEFSDRTRPLACQIVSPGKQKFAAGRYLLLYCYTMRATTGELVMLDAVMDPLPE